VASSAIESVLRIDWQVR